MLQGESVTLHPQTLCYLSASGDESELDGAQCLIKAYDSNAKKWRVQLVAREWEGRVLLVPEAALRIGFCLLPSSPSRRQMFARVAGEMQGSCGRGLTVQEPVDAGAPILSEPPFMVAGALVGSVSAKHAERWFAYGTLRMNAEAEAKHDGPCAKALAAFMDLGIGEHLPAHVLEASNDIAASANGITEAERAEYVQHVYGVLARCQSNQFRLHNGVDPDNAALSCSGLYDFISRVNHSCDPSIAIVPKSTFCGWRGVPWTLADAGGVLLGYALRDLTPGDAITFNYGPHEMLTENWDVNKRRDYLRAKLGFLCGCSRCVAELEAEAKIALSTAHQAQVQARGEEMFASPAAAQDELPSRDALLEETGLEEQPDRAEPQHALDQTFDERNFQAAKEVQSVSGWTWSGPTRVATGVTFAAAAGLLGFAVLRLAAARRIVRVYGQL